MTFAGVPAKAFDFYQRLEADNSRTFWDAHKGDYQRFVREPLTALVGELEDEFGPATLFRPHRDTRFSADKSPYKMYQGAFVDHFQGMGLYMQVSADGLLAGGGFHSHAPDQVERYRDAVADDATGSALADIVARLVSDGLTLEGEQLKTRPRGVQADHPRVELLRYRSLTAGRMWPPGPQLNDRGALELVRRTWRELMPLCDWLGEHVGGPGSGP
jgi:uncharacterized protein (TIGR02453 family)